jgi:hypothetical protein
VPGAPGREQQPDQRLRVKEEVLAELRLPPFNAQHGAHIDWVPKSSSGQVIDAKILGSHTVGGGDVLLAVYPQTPAHITYSSGTR